MRFQNSPGPGTVGQVNLYCRWPFLPMPLLKLFFCQSTSHPAPSIHPCSSPFFLLVQISKPKEQLRLCSDLLHWLLCLLWNQIDFPCMGTSRIYPLTFSLRLCIRSKKECESYIWLSALARNMSHSLLENSLLLSSAWKYGNCQTCLDTRVNILSLMLASTRCFRERSEMPVAGRYGIIPFLSPCFREQYSQHTHKYRLIRAHWTLSALESSLPGNIVVFCVASSIVNYSLQQRATDPKDLALSRKGMNKTKDVECSSNCI